MEKLGKPTFGFDFISYEETVTKFNNLKCFKKNIDIVSYFLYHNFNNSL